MDTQKIGVVYSKATGRILCPITCSLVEGFDETQLDEGLGIMEVFYGFDHTHFRVDVTQDPHELIELDELPNDFAELDFTRAEALQTVDNSAGELRTALGSTGYGQESVYLVKENQARAYCSAVSPIDAEYPMLLAEVGITADTVAEVANVICDMAETWRSFVTDIEAIRLMAKKQIKLASSIGEIENILDSISWPSPN